MRRFLLVPVLIALCSFGVRAQQQEQTDSLVRLLSATRMEQVDRNGQNYRKVVGPARFLHNNTFLICDTAFWNMNTSIIECINNVSIVQEGTKLTSDKLIYLVDDDLAQFRGTLVQLEDKDGNTLRTRYLDYNTRDSVAVFINGGAMRDKDGQIIESRDGSYDSKIKLFAFKNDVNMFTDSVFIKTTTLDYYSDSGMAYFGTGTNAWKEENMLSSEDGWYDRARELFLFKNKVHGMNNTQEMWADSLFYNRLTTEVELLGNAQVSDTSRNSHGLAGRMVYTDSLSRITMTRNPVLIGIQKDKEKVDTVYARADFIQYQTIPKCDLDSSAVQSARTRLADVGVDAVATYRKKVAEEAKKAAEEAKKNDPNAAPQKLGKGAKADEPEKKPEVTDSLNTGRMPADSLGSGISDSLGTGLSDSLAAVAPVVPKDSTKIGFMKAIGRFKLFKSDLQMVSDSLEYTDLDSLIRLYKRPLIWNDEHRQYASDSLFAVIKNGTIEKASLMSDAFVIIQEDSLCFDQIRSTEMMAYFDTTGTIRRFDAMGDADAIFYIQEDSTYATVNFSKSKILSATFKEGNIDQVYYFDQAKSDAYPVAQIKKEQRELKGFSWTPDARPKSKADITDKELRLSQRKDYASRPRATFKETETYFPGYMSKVYEDIERAREERRIRREQKEAAEKAARDSIALVNSLKEQSDSIGIVKDSLSIKNMSDSLASKPAIDSTVIKNSADSLSAAKPLTEKELKKLEEKRKKEEKERIRKEREAQKEREWARLDSLDAAKAAQKAALKLEKERKKKLKALEKMRERQAKEDALLQKYIEYFRKKKAAEDAKDAEKQQKIQDEEMRKELSRQGIEED